MPWYYGVIQASISGTFLALIAYICTRFFYKWIHKKVLVTLWIVSALRYLCIFTIPFEKGISFTLPTINISLEIYIIAAFAVLIYYYNSYRQQIYHIRKLSNCTDTETIKLFEEIRQEYDTDNVILRTEYSNDAPYTIGFMNPKIIVALQRLTFTDLPFVLRHELCHIKSYDCLKNLLFITVRVVHFFNPFVYVLMPYARQAIELSCDASVIANKSVNSKEYGNSLLNQASMVHHTIPMTTNYVPHTNALKQRINALVITISDTCVMLSKGFAVLFCLIAFSSLYFQTYSVKAVDNPNPIDKEEIENVGTQEPEVTTAPDKQEPPVTTTTLITTTTPPVTTTPIVTTTSKVTTTVPTVKEKDINISLSLGSVSSKPFENYIDFTIKTPNPFEYTINYIKVHHYNESNVEFGEPFTAYENKNDAISPLTIYNPWKKTIKFYSVENTKNLKFEVGYYNKSLNKEGVFYSDYIDFLFAIETYTIQKPFTYKNDYFRMILENEKNINGKICFHTYFIATSDKESRIKIFRVYYYKDNELLDTFAYDFENNHFGQNPNLSYSNTWGTNMGIPFNKNATHIQFVVEYVDGLTGQEFTGSDNVKYPYSDVINAFGKDGN